jgi:hypothetical protein
VNRFLLNLPKPVLSYKVEVVNACRRYSVLSAIATCRSGAKSGEWFVRAVIRSMRREVDTSICSSRRIGDRSSRATQWPRFKGGGACTIGA